jgi:hypothetical protein
MSPLEPEFILHRGNSGCSVCRMPRGATAGLRQVEEHVAALSDKSTAV